MHDTVREMCVWLTTGEHVKASNTFLVDAGRGSTEAPGAHFWGDVKRISLMHNDIVALPNEIPTTCSALLTLLINHNRSLRSVPGTGFSSMPALCVLDLSFTNLEDIPVEIGVLLQLRYLKLSATKIRALPKELGNLAKLRQLILRGTRVERIPRGAVMRLPNLQTLNLFGSTYEWCWRSEQTQLQLGGDDHHGHDDGEAQLSLNDLEGLERLSDLGLRITTSSCLEGFLRSRKLLRSTRFLTVMVPDFRAACDLSETFLRMDGLRRLEFRECYGLKGDFRICGGGRLPKLEYLHLDDLPRDISLVVGMVSSFLPCLRILVLQRCHSLRDLTWVARQLPSLEELQLLENDEIEELARGGAGDEVDQMACSFPRLKMMHLQTLPRLRVISRHRLLFPALERLQLVYCLSLEELQFVQNDQIEELARGGAGDEADHMACSFPRLKKMGLRDLPRLRVISRHPQLFPALERLRVLGCPQLRKLPLERRSAKKLREIRGEPEWWDALEWDPVDDITRSTFLSHFRPWPWLRPYPL